MVANEAQAMGKPIICTAACGCANDLVISGFNGLVVSDFRADKKQIIDFIHQLPENKLAYEQFAHRNNQVFAVDRLSREMLAGMQKLVNH
jgi:glycosyltransferase involved in cell wall biosynthesis